MQDKQIRIGVDDSQLKSIGRTSQSIVDNLIRSSRQYSTSSKEVLRDIEEQIKAIEKKNKIELEGRKQVIDAEKRRITMLRDEMMYEAKAIGDPKKRASAIREVSAEYSASKSNISAQESVLRASQAESVKQTQVLREVIDEIKTASRNEIRENREGVEKTIRKDKSLDKFGVTGDAKEALKRTIQRGELGDVKEQEARERSNFLRKTGGFLNNTVGVASSKNDLYALAAVAGFTPVIGQAVSAAMQRLLSSGETAEKSMTSYGRSSFGSYSTADREWQRSKSLGLTSLGYDPSEILERRSGLLRTTSRSISDLRFKQLMGAEQYVGAGTIDQMAGINRYGGGDMAQVLQVLEGNQRNITRLTENVSAYVQASNTTLQIGSRINEGQMAKTIMSISAATGQTGIGLNQTTSAIQGLGQSGNPIVRSLMMRAYRQSNPNANLFDIQSMMEDPLSSFKQGGRKFFSNIKEMSGGGEMYKQVLYSIFGGQMSRTRINEIIKGGGDFTEIQSEIDKKSKGNIDWLAESSKSTGISTRLTAETDTAFQDWGKEMIKVSNDSVETLKKLFDEVGKERSTSETIMAAVIPIPMLIRDLIKSVKDQ